MAKPKPKSKAKPKVKPKAKSKVKPKPKTKSKPKAKPKVKPKARPKSKPMAKPKAKPKHWLAGKEFATKDDVRTSIQEWMDSKPAGFWVKGIVELPNRWAKVVEYEGDYFPDE
uniref:Uncharacterized protein n=1 Tax=Acrobeloides nanus TaxID=290746 RepID=A0A914E695_9BILA